MLAVQGITLPREDKDAGEEEEERSGEDSKAEVGHAAAADPALTTATAATAAVVTAATAATPNDLVFSEQRRVYQLGDWEKSLCHRDL